jgi:hypothetical protein
MIMEPLEIQQNDISPQRRKERKAIFFLKTRIFSLRPLRLCGKRFWANAYLEVPINFVAEKLHLRLSPSGRLRAPHFRHPGNCSLRCPTSRHPWRSQARFP